MSDDNKNVVIHVTGMTSPQEDEVLCEKTRKEDY